MATTVSVIIPTKNRLRLLTATVGALLEQTVAVDQLVVVDQSDTEDGRAVIGERLRGMPAARRPQLDYVWDRGINGAAAARNVGLDLAWGDIVVFLDDDVLPEPEVLERLMAHYDRAPHVAGIAPIITNYDTPSALNRLFDACFSPGPFYDERQRVYWFWRRLPDRALVPVRMFTGAMMSFRRAAVGSLRFDRRYCGPSVGEDVDFCWTLGARGERLAIATDARIVHNRAPRPDVRPEEAIITSWGYLFYKHLPQTFTNRARFVWFLVGVALGGLRAAARERTWRPLRSVWSGLVSVTHDFDGSNFLMPAPRRRERSVGG
jgi:GT2 family glycosyltransferase